MKPLTLALLIDPAGPADSWAEKMVAGCGHRAVRIDPRNCDGGFDLILVRGADAPRAYELWRRHPVPVVVVCDGCDRGAMDHLPSSWSCLTEPVSRADLEAAVWTAIGNFDRLCAAFGELARMERELDRLRRL